MTVRLYTRHPNLLKIFMPIILGTQQYRSMPTVLVHKAKVLKVIITLSDVYITIIVKALIKHTFLMKMTLELKILFSAAKRASFGLTFVL